MPAHLVLWDIDKTLVDIGTVSGMIYAEAFQAATGRALEHMPSMAGRTDHDITLAALRQHNVPDPESHLPRFYDALAAATRAWQDEIRRKGRRLPGALEAVSALDLPGVVQTVVTGNIRRTAEIKLEAFGLAEHIDFAIGGYGSDDGARSTLVRLARQRAARKHGEIPARQVIVIGDTVNDIAGARANGVIAIGVGTGAASLTELQAAGADAVLPSLADPELVRLVLGGAG